MNARRLPLLVMLLVASFCTGMWGGESFSQQVQAPKADLRGDPLPPRAMARLGTLRWRHAGTFVAFVDRDKALLTNRLDGSFRVWNRETGDELRRLDVPPPPIAGSAIQQIFNIRGYAVWGGGPQQRVAALSANGKMLALAVSADRILLLDIATGKSIRQIGGPQAGVALLRFAPDGKILAARAGDGVIHFLDLETGKEIRQIKPGQLAAATGIVGNHSSGSMKPFAFSFDGKTLATPEADFDQQRAINFVKLTSVETGDEIGRIDVPSAIRAVAFSPDAKLLAVALPDMISLRDAACGMELRRINVVASPFALVFSPDGKKLASKARDNMIWLIETETGQPFKLGDHGFGVPHPSAHFLLAPRISDPHEVAFSSDSKTAATSAGTVRLWNTANGKELRLGGGHHDRVSAVGISADGKTVLSYGVDSIVRRWNLADGRELDNFRGWVASSAAVFPAGGKTVAFAAGHAAIHLHDAATGKYLAELQGHPDGPGVLAVSPEGNVLASLGLADGTLRLHDLLKRTELRAHRT